MAPFETYAQAYQTMRMERRTGIVQRPLHPHGAVLPWGALPPQAWDAPSWAGKLLRLTRWDSAGPMRSAINGPALCHSASPLLCAIVLAAEETTGQEAAPLPHGLGPGAGEPLDWPVSMAVGNRRVGVQRCGGQDQSRSDNGPRLPCRPLGLDEGPGQSVTRPHERLTPESDPAILCHHVDKGAGWTKDVAVGTVIPYAQRGNEACYPPLREPGGAVSELSPIAQNQLKQNATTLAEVCQRSSSNVG